ncbi:MAG: FAD-binding oxidoreductase [Dehalococcoidia bacterium]|nr:FAD-binding oxidoreductase [Dehalococcoidia bacterium]
MRGAVKTQRPGEAGTAGVDVRRLAAHLRAAGLQGEVRFDEGSRALYATDGSNYRQVPLGVVVPKSTQDVMTTMAICREYGAPFLSRGGGTSLAGQCCNVAVVLDMSKYYNRILELDAEGQRARVQPGLVLDELRNAAEEHHLTFAPDPSTHNHCTLGGMIGNNSCGVHSVMGGKTDDNIEALDVLTYDGLRLNVGPTSEEELQAIVSAGGRRGEIYARLRAIRDTYGDEIRERFPNIPRRVSGFALNQLLPENGFNVARALVGTEGTCVCVLEATCRLVPSPPKRSLLVLGYPDVGTAGDHVPACLEYGPIGLEGIDDYLVEDMKKKNLHPQNVQILPPGKGWLLVEFGGETKQEADDRARALMEAVQRSERPPSTKLFSDPREEAIIWKVRESGLGATARVPGEEDTWEGWEDAAVDPSRLGKYLREFRGLLDRYGYACALYGHFGQGCVHTRIDFDLKTKGGIDRFRSFLDDAADLVVANGGSISGEHGDGQSKAALLPKMYGERLVRAFGEFKAAWYPQGRMNPGKVVDPYQPTQNLRYGADYEPIRVRTEFAYPDDRFSFGYAMERCVGVGECRRHGGGTMCPSYMVTREEQHSTRGRARLLWEMMQGKALSGLWRNKAVREALDLCLACKGCKGDCPMNVDMATYKAEFLAHYYHMRPRPLAAYSMGLIYWWARLASKAPGAANALAHTPLLASLVKRAGGIAPEREVPRFAPRTFREWFRRHPPSAGSRGKVILWPDTFTNHFLPARARDAVAVLEAAGFAVAIPQKSLCCGRPLYDWGMVGTARRLWRQTLETLREDIRAGVPVVGLEPSCVSAFRDELQALFPNDEDACRLSSQTFMLSEFLEQQSWYEAPKLEGKAIVQGHCHHRAIMKLDAEEKLMADMGLEAEVLDSGCCGMAGAFGFERGKKYEVAMACGERVLLPAVRGAPDDTLIIADGFSCTEQIAQGAGRKAIHLAQALKLALDRAGGTRPAAALSAEESASPGAGSYAAAATLGGAAVLLAVLSRRKHEDETAERS